jgi:hypothetical protein
MSEKPNRDRGVIAEALRENSAIHFAKLQGIAYTIGMP